MGPHVEATQILTEELRTRRPVAVRTDGTWSYAPPDADMLAHGYAQIIAGEVHAAYFLPTSKTIVLRRGRHACELRHDLVSIRLKSSRWRSSRYQVACPHRTEEVCVRFRGGALRRRLFGLYDAMEEHDDDIYAYLSSSVSPDWLANVEGVWDMGFGPAYQVDVG